MAETTPATPAPSPTLLDAVYTEAGAWLADVKTAIDGLLSQLEATTIANLPSLNSTLVAAVLEFVPAPLRTVAPWLESLAGGAALPALTKEETLLLQTALGVALARVNALL